VCFWRGYERPLPILFSAGAAKLRLPRTIQQSSAGDAAEVIWGLHNDVVVLGTCRLLARMIVDFRVRRSRYDSSG